MAGRVVFVSSLRRKRNVRMRRRDIRMSKRDFRRAFAALAELELVLGEAIKIGEFHRALAMALRAEIRQNELKSGAERHVGNGDIPLPIDLDGG